MVMKKMKKLYIELQDRLAFLKKQEETEDVKSRITELMLVIIRVQQILLIDESLERDAYHLYTTGMKSKWIKCVPFEEFKSVYDHELYIETAKAFRKELKESHVNVNVVVEVTTEKEHHCIDCGAKLTNGFTHRCPLCWDDIYFPK